MLSELSPCYFSLTLTNSGKKSPGQNHGCISQDVLWGGGVTTAGGGSVFQDAHGGQNPSSST